MISRNDVHGRERSDTTPGDSLAGVSALCDRPPLPQVAAWRAVAMCAGATAGMLWRGQIHLPAGHVGKRIRFADGTTAPVYRETVVDRGPIQDPCALVVEFRLRVVRGRGHTLFRWESLLNTPLFVGFPGFVSKLWLAHDEHGRYRGIYEWDGSFLADCYARALWRVLALVSVPGSIHYVVLLGLHRDDLVTDSRKPGATASGEGAWWRPVGVS
jgi:hypothetical protein